jgi:hypothetical protein
MVVSGDDSDYGTASAGKVVVFCRPGVQGAGAGGRSGDDVDPTVWLLSIPNAASCALFMSCMVSLVPRIRGVFLPWVLGTVGVRHRGCFVPWVLDTVGVSYRGC